MYDRLEAASGPYQTIDDLRHAIDSTLREVLSDTDKCALFGFPDHSNVGDSAIWLGELSYLKAQGIEVVYECSARSYSEDSLLQAIGEGTILLHGGGNLGSIWPNYHSIVLDFISRHHDNRIVVLPQTIHFEDADLLAATKNTVAEHGNVTILVRDAASLKTARNELGSSAFLCPDLALWLAPSPGAHPTVDVLYIRRRDRESSHLEPSELPPGVMMTDWIGLESLLLRRRTSMSALYRLNRRLSGHLRRADRYEPGLEHLARTVRNSLARQRLNLGLDLLRSGRVIVTDRLHAYLLSLLLGKQGVILDNSYGKIRFFYETWMRGVGRFRWTESPDEAVEIGMTLARQG